MRMYVGFCTATDADAGADADILETIDRCYTPIPYNLIEYLQTDKNRRLGR